MADTSYIEHGIRNFITFEVLPSATDAEKMVIATANSKALKLFGGFDVNATMEKIRTSPIWSNSQLFIEGGEIDLVVAKELAIENLFALAPDGRYKYKGKELDLVFTKVKLFEGLIVTQETINDLFEYIKKAKGELQDGSKDVNLNN